ncbi:MAG: hypothetical protein GY737_02775 [Desulfobacteraceae bacterium]|nr:hypothetical protein [Desulfobacteraceae bacterium]
MKKALGKTIESILALVVVIIVSANMAYADPLVTMACESANGWVGQEFKLKIMITDEDIVNTAGWDGRIIYDPDYFSFQAVSAGDLTPAENTFAFNTPEPGKVIMINYSTQLKTISGQGIIAEVLFIPRLVGDSVIELQNFTFSDSTASPIPATLDSGLVLSIKERPTADLDGDNDIDGIDLSLFAKAYEEGNPPVSLAFLAENYSLCTKSSMQ